MREKQLSNGYKIRCKDVPPYAVTMVYDRNPQPVYPFIEEISIAGSVEELPALEGTEEFAQWQEEMRNWRVRINADLRTTRLALGVISWKSPNGEWTDAPPKDWEVPRFLREFHEVETSDKESLRRVQYIQFELVQTPDDMEWLEEAVGLTRTSQSAPITEEEVEAAQAPLASQDQEEDH